jgi:cyclic dehypoxanthinyl futalosine synthase
MGETPRDRAEHLLRIRELQDETLGFTAFIPWSYQPDGTRLGGSRASAIDYLRVVAVSRLMLDNVENIQAGWLTEGGDMAQLALSFGANDFGGVITKEEVVKAAGGKHHLSLDEILRLIRASGRSPIQRDTYYRRIRKFE